MELWCWLLVVTGLMPVSLLLCKVLPSLFHCLMANCFSIFINLIICLSFKAPKVIIHQQRQQQRRQQHGFALAVARLPLWRLVMKTALEERLFFFVFYPLYRQIYLCLSVPFFFGFNGTFCVNYSSGFFFFTFFFFGFFAHPDYY